jgi:hypothetical protein
VISLETVAPEPWRRRFLLSLLAVALFGLVLRLLPLLGPDGPMGVAGDYDDGVYFAASALLLRGVLPYRDFVFVHPPGVTYFFALTSWMSDPADGFAAARIVTSIVGTLNIALVGLIARRAAGSFAGIVAALLYASFPDAISAERSVYLEPLLNLFALSSAFVWLSPKSEGRRRPLIAGLLAGSACAMKLLGGIWVVAACLSAIRGRAKSDLWKLIAAGAAAGALLLAPLALRDVRAFMTQVLWFQLSRPPDGQLQRAARLVEIFGSGHEVVSMLALVALVAILLNAARRRFVEISRAERFFAVATLLTVVAFLASSSYWRQYNSYLAASECVLAGLGAASHCRCLEPFTKRATFAVVAVAILAVHLSSLRLTLESLRSPSDELPRAARDIRSVVPREASLFAFDPTWAIAGGHLARHDGRTRTIVDSYGAMLLEAVRRGGAYATTDAAFRGAPPSRDLRALLAASQFVIPGWRGRWQMNDEDRSWFDANFVCVTSGELCVWQKTAQPLTGLTVVPAGLSVTFGNGWYEEEGEGASSWRWMSGRSEVILPALPTAARLGLQLSSAHDSSTPQQVVLEIDGVPIARESFASSELQLSVLVPPTNSATRRLTITTDRTFKPSSDGRSTDTRELGPSLHRLIWLPVTSK